MGQVTEISQRGYSQYCQAIYELHEEKIKVIRARIAERLDISRPAVSEMIVRMSNEKLVTIGNTGVIALTAKGNRLATAVVRRHRIAERFLTDILELPWSVSSREANRWEHAISQEVEERMVELLKNPTTCPHGNPIPGSGYEMPKPTMTLNELDEGQKFSVVRIPESLQRDIDGLAYLEENEIMPGTNALIETVAPDGTTLIRVGKKPIGLASSMTRQIVITPI